MAHSLEVRVPLVDAKLLNHMAMVPMKNGALCKRMLGDSPSLPLPRNVIERPKTGFGTPIQTWLQRDTRIQHWRRIPAFAVDRCSWARRWAFEMAAA
jgi:asparagine synthase (glutamine-hydrolysing)